jgi:hypothetical protein
VAYFLRLTFNFVFDYERNFSSRINVTDKIVIIYLSRENLDQGLGNAFLLISLKSSALSLCVQNIFYLVLYLEDTKWFHNAGRGSTFQEILRWAIPSYYNNGNRRIF